MAVYIRFKNNFSNGLNSVAPAPAHFDVHFGPGFALHTAAWIVSLVSLALTLLVKPAKKGELTAEAAGAV